MFQVHWIEYVVIAVYLLLIISMGLTFKSFSKDISDYFRGGCQGTWWLVGISIFMQGFSALTFTGICGQAFTAGSSLMIVFWSNALGYFIQGLIFAPWMRQSRCITGGDLIYNRFGRAGEQFYIYYGFLATFLWSAVMLLGTATFIYAVFGIPVWILIVVIGFSVILYATGGGSLGVMSADFLQATVLFPITIAITVLALIKVGGISGLLNAIESTGLSSDFALIKEVGYQYKTPIKMALGSFSWGWVSAMAFNSILSNMSAYKYLAVKDGKSARKAGIFCSILMLLGSAIWFIPPMVARIYYYDQVMAMTNIGNPADSAYAIISCSLLPNGLIGVLVVAMLAATMSNLDSSFTGCAGMLTRNAYPPFMKLIGKSPSENPKTLLLLGKIFNAVIAIIIIGLALLLAQQKDTNGLFSIMLSITALFGGPAAVPFGLGLVWKKAPSWALFTSLGTGVIGSLVCLYFKKIGIPFMWYQELYIVIISAFVGWLLAVPFWKSSPQKYKEQVELFFKTIHTPIDFEKEVGSNSDLRLFKVTGTFSMILGGLIMLLLLVKNSYDGKLIIIIIAISTMLLGLAMIMLGKWSKHSAENNKK